MSEIKAVRDYLKKLPGLRDLSLDSLNWAHGAAFLMPLGTEGVRRTYLDGSQLRQVDLALVLRRGSQGGETAREADLRFLSDLAETLEENTRRGALPDLGPGKRAWSLRATDTGVTELLQENGLMVDQLTLRLEYFVEGS